MAKITTAHLEPFLRELKASVLDGTIPLDEAMSWHVDVEFFLLEERVRQGKSSLFRAPAVKVTKRGNDD